MKFILIRTIKQKKMNNEHIKLPESLCELLLYSEKENGIFLRPECRDVLKNLMKGSYCRKRNEESILVKRNEYVITTLENNVITYCKINGVYNDVETMGFLELLDFVSIGF
jgi:hypothetical protein